jgi:hypothetical protein
MALEHRVMITGEAQPALFGERVFLKATRKKGWRFAQ